VDPTEFGGEIYAPAHSAANTHRLHYQDHEICRKFTYGLRRESDCTRRRRLPDASSRSVAMDRGRRR